MPERKFVGKKFPSLFAMEESVLDFWQRDKTYEKSLEQTKNGEVFSFYDGPPFITGIPHYATLLPSIAKDVVPRFQTMKGRFVRRTWGWDVHGLPAENQVEKKLGLKSKKIYRHWVWISLSRSAVSTFRKYRVPGAGISTISVDGRISTTRIEPTISTIWSR